MGSDQATWTVLSSKFKQDSQGNFFNERLAAEIVKRRKFSESRRENASKRYSKDAASAGASAEHMHEHMENRNRNKVVDRGPGEEEGIFTIEHCIVVAMADERWVRANKATVQGLKEFNQFLEGQGVYKKSPIDYKQHYHNWKRKPGKNGQSQELPSHTQSTGGPTLPNITYE